jgi:hypothetical protein
MPSARPEQELLDAKWERARPLLPPQGVELEGRRWTDAWLHSYQRIVTRFEKRVALYDGFVHRASAFIARNRLV